jgi:hypothetical protein
MSVEAINNTLFWWSIISTIIGIILTVISIGLAVYSWKEARGKKDQVKIWQHQANGISVGLSRIVSDVHQGLYTDKKDVTSAIWAMQMQAFSLYQSLYEERTVSEKEYARRQQEMYEEIRAAKNSAQTDISDDEKNRVNTTN